MNLDDLFIMICTSFHKIMVSTKYVPHQMSPKSLEPGVSLGSSKRPTLSCKLLSPRALAEAARPVEGIHSGPKRRT